MMIRGTHPPPGRLDWFGLAGPFSSPHPNLFSHVGGASVMGSGDPDSDIQIVLITTDDPVQKRMTGAFRNRVTGLVCDAVRTGGA